MEVKKVKPIWVVVFLRGAADGLSLVYPTEGKDREIYEAARPTLKIASDPKTDFKLNNHLALHPSAKELFALYQNKKLAVLHGVGLVADSRSHFDAQNIMEQGAESKSRLLHSGWIARYLRSAKPSGKIPVVSISQNSPTSIYTFDQALVLDAIRNHHFPIAPKFEMDFEKSLHALYAFQAKDRPWLAEWGTQTLDTMNELKELNAKGAESPYPKNELGGKLQTLAELLVAKPEIEMATVDMGGWDTHKSQGSGKDGTFGNQVAQLSQSLSYFFEDVSKHRPLLITVQTEFGRRLKENFSRGTDHGHGGVMMVLGDSVKGGQMFGKWPGLSNEQLYQGADLAVTTDYRDVLSELLLKEMQIKHIHDVFPNFTPKPGLGIV